MESTCTTKSTAAANRWLLHGAFMTITNNWAGWISELSKTRKVIAVEMQGHGRTADVPRDITYENLADDVAALLNHLKVARADLIGYSMGGAVAMQTAIRHPDKVRRAVIFRPHSAVTAYPRKRSKLSRTSRRTPSKARPLKPSTRS